MAGPQANELVFMDAGSVEQAGGCARSLSRKCNVTSANAKAIAFCESHGVGNCKRDIYYRMISFQVDRNSPHATEGACVTNRSLWPRFLDLTQTKPNQELNGL